MHLCKAALSIGISPEVVGAVTHITAIIRRFTVREQLPQDANTPNAFLSLALWFTAQTTDLGSVTTMQLACEKTVIPDQEQRSVILVVEDVEETRHGIERLLTASGYQVSTARDEEEAVQKAGLRPPNLILVSLGLDAVQVLPVIGRMRERAGIGERVPVVVFCVTSLKEGGQVAAGHNVYMTRPDNFNQLRGLLSRLLRKRPGAG